MGPTLVSSPSSHESRQFIHEERPLWSCLDLFSRQQVRRGGTSSHRINFRLLYYWHFQIRYYTIHDAPSGPIGANVARCVSASDALHRLTSLPAQCDPEDEWNGFFFFFFCVPRGGNNSVSLSRNYLPHPRRTVRRVGLSYGM